MPLSLYVVDAFTERPFAGNPAAVCPLERWLDERAMQDVAAENNLSETAFFVRRPDGDYDLRWFTPKVEIELCGHATLASAFTVFRFLDPAAQRVRFHTKSGPLEVARRGAQLEMSLPARPPSPWSAPRELRDALGAPASEWLRGIYALAVFDSENVVRELAPDFRTLRQLDACVIATAPGERHDFVSRFFAPSKGIDEDPVTGSAHCTLVPYWTKRLGKRELAARQISARGGELACVDAGERVILRGECALYSQARIEIG
jgi:PhzF family phenazine biosynthesis protein